MDEDEDFSRSLNPNGPQTVLVAPDMSTAIEEDMTTPKKRSTSSRGIGLGPVPDITPGTGTLSVGSRGQNLNGYNQEKRKLYLTWSAGLVLVETLETLEIMVRNMCFCIVGEGSNSV